MGSAATVDPPEGFQLDEPNAMAGGWWGNAASKLYRKIRGDFEKPQDANALFRERTNADMGVLDKMKAGASMAGNAMVDMYHRIQAAEDDSRMPSDIPGEELAKRAMLGPETLLPGFGKAAGGVVEGIGAAGARAARNPWTSEMVNNLRALDETFAGKPYANSKIIDNFRELHPEYTGSDATIQTMIYRRRNTGVNTDTGAIASGESSVKNPGVEANLADDAVTGSHGVRGLGERGRPGYEFVETHPPHPDYPKDPRRFQIVYRDADGRVAGSMQFATDADKRVIAKNAYGEPESITMSVDPAYRDKGVALRLLQLARENGVTAPADVLRGMDYTKQGADFTNALMSRRLKKTSDEGGGFELGAMGGKGSTHPPQITALRDKLMGDPEFEALADTIRSKLEATHAETVGPAHTTYSQSSPRKEDVIRGVKLTYPTSPERLQEIADHAAAWQIYNKRVGGQDFELGAMGGRGSTARYAPQLSPQQQQEMRQLLQKHPEHADEIRASYGLDVPDVSTAAPSVYIDPKKAERERKGRHEVRSPGELPDKLPEGVVSRSDGTLDNAARQIVLDMRKAGSGPTEIARTLSDQLGVPVTTRMIEHTLDVVRRPVAEPRELLPIPESAPPRDLIRGRPPKTELGDEARQLMLDMARSGETHSSIAKALSERMGGAEVTRSMVGNHLARMRARSELEAAGLPIPPELHESKDWETSVQEGDPGRFASKQPLPNAMVAPQTRELTGAVSGAVDAINEDFPETRTTTKRKTIPGLPPGFVLDDANPNAMVPR